MKEEEFSNEITVHREDIVQGVQHLGVGKGDTVLVHSSLSSFGHVKGGAETVIQALLDIVGPAGNMVVPTLSFRSVSDDKPIYSITNTPSDTGNITEVFRQRPDALRSRHPMSSAAVIGADTKTIAGGKQITPCGVDSPYFHVYDKRGFVLFLGATFSSNTMFHVAEEIVNPDYLCYKRLDDCSIVMPDGQIVKDTFYRYNCTQTGIIRRHARLEDVYRDKGVIREMMIGKSLCMLIPARDNVDLACEMLEKNVRFILD